MAEKRFALQKKEGIQNGDGLDYPSYIQFTGGTIPTVFEHLHSTLQEATLFSEKQLAHVRHAKQGKTTRELIEEQLPDYELVEVVLSLTAPSLAVQYGEYLSDDIETQLNRQGYTLGIHKEMVNKLNDALKLFHFTFTSLTPEMEAIRKELEQKVLTHAEPLQSSNSDESTVNRMPELGDLIRVSDVNTHEPTYSTVSEIIHEDGEVKVFDEGGFNYLKDVTLVCKASHRLDTNNQKEASEKAETDSNTLPWEK